MGGKGRYQTEEQRAGKPNSICGSWVTLKKQNNTDGLACALPPSKQPLLEYVPSDAAPG